MIYNNRNLSYPGSGSLNYKFKNISETALPLLDYRKNFGYFLLASVSQQFLVLCACVHSGPPVPLSAHGIPPACVFLNPLFWENQL